MVCIGDSDGNTLVEEELRLENFNRRMSSWKNDSPIHNHGRNRVREVEGVDSC